MTTASSHRVRQTQHNIQCLYNLDRRIHAVQAYPVLSPQGASIVLYGHENGVTVLWRGGRRLKDAAPKKDEPKKQASDAVMVLDSDDDEPATTTTTATKTVFDNDGPAQATMDGGFLDVVQTLDLAFGTAVTSIAVLPQAPCAAAAAEPRLLQDHMVFAVACATAELYVVALPLTPPPRTSTSASTSTSTSMGKSGGGLLATQAGRGTFGERLLALGGSARSADGLAMALAKTQPAAGGAAGAAAATGLRVVVAAHAREAAGTLRLWAVTVPAPASAPSTTTTTTPFQTSFLPSPLTGLAFNPSHPTQLLAVDPRHAVRIYDYAVPALPAADDEDAAAAAAALPSQGSWLLSLYPPFVRSNNNNNSATTTTTSPRKPVVAAAWIARGHAVLALLADGQWGIWDIEGAGSASSSSSGLLGATTHGGGLRGAALTAFAVSGQLEGTTPLRKAGAAAAAAAAAAEGDFVPMTPHTRRGVLLGGSTGLFGGTAERLAGVRGGVTVVERPSSSSRRRRGRGGTPRETALLWLGGADYTVAVVPDVARFWDAQVRRGDGRGLFQGARPTRMTRLADLHASLLGERCCGVAVAAGLGVGGDEDDDDDDEVDDGYDDDNDDTPPEILIQGESRLVVVRETGADAFSGALAARLQAAAPGAAGRKRKVAGGSSISRRAIVVEESAAAPPKTKTKTGTVTFDLLGRGSLWGKPAATTGDEEADEANDAVPPMTPSVRHRRPPLKGLFDTPGKMQSTTATATTAMTPRRTFDDEVTLTMSMRKPPTQWGRKGGAAAADDEDDGLRAKTGLTFAGALEAAANAEDDEEAADDRNIEEEMLDIMEIDRALEALEQEGGGKNVFFEGM